jgi:mannose/cellobiose epimerase-like protein (N-acyl-D-glucosamine 2-epimerase family)
MTAALAHAVIRDADAWAGWFWAVWMPDWLARVADPRGGVYDLLDAAGTPSIDGPKTVLAQARTLFTLAHLALLSGEPALVRAADRQASALPPFRKAPGLYQRALAPDGTQTGDMADRVARSYDQTFVLLALVTWDRLSPSPATKAEIDACWHALTDVLTDKTTGLLRNDDSEDPTPPAQNPHMHLYEACLQAHEMTGQPQWMARASALRARTLQHFLDTESGSIAEWIALDLGPLSGPYGLRREPGHQCEWAWLLWREVELGGDPALRDLAASLMSFADRHGFAATGALQGAALDAVSPSGTVIDSSLLLWPQTEAIKAFAQRYMAGDAVAGDRARALLCLVFQHWFLGRLAFVNRLNNQGHSLWSEALTRLFYHLALALTEGARAGLWPGIPRHQ